MMMNGGGHFDDGQYHEPTHQHQGTPHENCGPSATCTPQYQCPGERQTQPGKVSVSSSSLNFLCKLQKKNVYKMQSGRTVRPKQLEDTSTMKNFYYSAHQVSKLLTQSAPENNKKPAYVILLLL